MQHFTKKQLEDLAFALADARMDARHENKIGHTAHAEIRVAEIIFGSPDGTFADRFFKRIGQIENRKLGRV